MTRVLLLALIVGLLAGALGGCPQSDEDKRASGARATAMGQAARTKPFVASAPREPFHASDCKWAKKIREENVMGFDTREAAMAGRHWPCKVCRP